MSSRRMRFSLLNCLLVMTIVAMAIGLWRLNGELAPLRTEVKRLREEMGHLVVEDETQLHAIQVSTVDDDTWRFRVWVPAGKQYWLCFQKAKIPQQGVPVKTTSGGSLAIDPGEHLIDLLIEPHDQREETLTGIVMVDGSRRFSGSISERDHDWIENDEVGGRHAGWSGVDLQAETMDPSQPMVLLKYRAAGVTNVRHDAKGEVIGYGHKEIQEPCEGFLVWISDTQP